MIYVSVLLHFECRMSEMIGEVTSIIFGKILFKRQMINDKSVNIYEAAVLMQQK